MRQRSYGRKAEKNQKWLIRRDKSTDRHTNPTLDEGPVNEDSDEVKDSQDNNETRKTSTTII